MAAMSNGERVRAARLLARRIFEESNATANMDANDLLAAVIAVDNALESTPGNLPNPSQSIAVNLNLLLPDPFKTTASVEQKAALLAITVGVKYGAI